MVFFLIRNDIWVFKPLQCPELPRNSSVLYWPFYSAATKNVTVVGLSSPCVYVEIDGVQY